MENFYDQIISIKHKLTNEEFISLMNSFILTFKNSNQKILKNLSKNEYTSCQCQESDICINNDINKLKDCKNYKKFIEINPIVELIFENKIIEFTSSPILYPNTSYNIITNNLRNLHLLGNMNYSFDNMVIIGSALYDYLMRNLFICMMQPKETIIDILNIKNFQSLEFFKKINFDTNIWINTFISSICKNPPIIPEPLTGEIINGNLSIKANLDENIYINIDEIISEL
jgi:hypothetical protein